MYWTKLFTKFSELVDIGGHSYCNILPIHLYSSSWYSKTNCNMALL